MVRFDGYGTEICVIYHRWLKIPNYIKEKSHYSMGMIVINVTNAIRQKFKPPINEHSVPYGLFNVLDFHVTYITPPLVANPKAQH